MKKTVFGAFSRRFAVGCLLLPVLCFSQARAQDVTNLYTAGVSYNPGASPAVAGSALYAHQLSPDTAPGMFAFTQIDALPSSVKPFTVSTNIGMGIAQRVFTIGSVPIFVPTSAGISFNGTNVGWQWSTGAGAPIKLSHHPAGQGDWYVMPVVRVLKSSVSGDGYRPIVGIQFGFGK